MTDHIEGKMDTYWASKRVLVTGADGFVGSHLTETLVDLGAVVSIFVRTPPYRGTGQHIFRNIARSTHEGLEHVMYGDIADRDAINLMRSKAPDVIFHLAASVYVPFSFDHPMGVVHTNLGGTLNVLEAARRIPNLQRLVCTSSGDVYGPALDTTIGEEHPLNPTSLYAASKLAADRYAYAYQNTYKLPIAIIRPFNTYGPRQTYDVIPKFIGLALKGEPITIYGNGSQTRDFLYIGDLIRGYLLMGSHQSALRRAINFGSGRDISIKQLALLIKELSKSSSEIVHSDTRPAEVDHQRCDFRLANELLGWAPEVSLRQGVAETIRWSLEESSCVIN